MVAAINAPKTGNTLDAFKALAKNATTSTSPPGGPQGGVLSKGGNGTSTGTASGTGAATSAATSSAGNTATGPSSRPSIVPANGAEKMGAQLVGAFVVVLAAGFAMI